MTRLLFRVTLSAKGTSLSHKSNTLNITCAISNLLKGENIPQNNTLSLAEDKCLTNYI